MRLALCDNFADRDWDRVRENAIRQLTPLRPLPPWVTKVLEADLDTLRGINDEVESYVTCEMTQTTQDYLDFVRGQIALNARGPEWTALLAERLSRLSPYIGRPLLRVTIGRNGDQLIMRLRPPDFDLVHWEFDESAWAAGR